MTEQVATTHEQTSPGRCCRGGWRSGTLVAAFCLLLITLGGRVVWVAAGTETGWFFLRSQWWEATLGLLAGKNPPISQREPSEQAVFWLPKAQRIAAEEPQKRPGARWGPRWCSTRRRRGSRSAI